MFSAHFGWKVLAGSGFQLKNGKNRFFTFFSFLAWKKCVKMARFDWSFRFSGLNRFEIGQAIQAREFHDGFRGLQKKAKRGRAQATPASSTVRASAVSGHGGL
jgi:hypothetical protein